MGDIYSSYQDILDYNCHSEPQGRMTYGGETLEQMFDRLHKQLYEGPTGNKPPSTCGGRNGTETADPAKVKVSTQFYMLLDKQAHELHEVANSLAAKLSQVSSPMSDVKKEEDIKHAWPEYFDGLRDIAESIESSVEMLKVLDKYLEF